MPASTKETERRRPAAFIKTLHPNTVDLTGKAFGYYEVLGAVHEHRGSRRRLLWVCRCRCGRLRRVLGTNLRRRSGSCGCAKGERISAKCKRHGMTGRRVWRIWKGMIERCHKKAYGKSYARYGGRGIYVWHRWRGKDGFKNFLADMGDPGEGSNLTLDRRNNNGPYCKTNCRWRTQYEQHRNRSDNRLLTHKGVTKCLADWADETGIRRDTLTRRIDKYGYTVAEALTIPVRRHRRTRVTN